jgi:hypothetical protein
VTCHHPTNKFSNKSITNNIRFSRLYPIRVPLASPSLKSVQRPGTKHPSASAQGWEGKDGEQQRQAGAGGGGEDGSGGIDRRLRVPAQAPGGQSLSRALQGAVFSLIPWRSDSFQLSCVAVVCAGHNYGPSRVVCCVGIC